MIDNEAELMPATVREWTDILARIRFGTVRVAGKGMAGARIKLVAARLADYADSNGSRIHPGLARLAVDLETDYRSVRAAVVHLRAVGLLQVVRAGKGVKADEYRLTLPVDLLERDDVEMWSPTRHANEVERVRAANRGRYRPSPNGPRGSDLPGPQGPAEDGHMQGPQGPADESDTPISAGATGADISRPAGATGADMQGPQGPATDQRPIHNYDRPADEEDVRTAVTGPRARRPDPNPAPPTRPRRCAHGLSGALRPDRQPVCALCRVEAAQTPEPDPAPPDGERLAAVIQLPTREAS